MPREVSARPAHRAGVLQVAKTMFFGVLMIGRKATWEEGGEAARMTPMQLVIGALAGGIILIAALVALVRTVLRLAGG